MFYNSKFLLIPLRAPNTLPLSNSSLPFHILPQKRGEDVKPPFSVSFIFPFHRLRCFRLIIPQRTCTIYAQFTKHFCDLRNDRLHIIFFLHKNSLLSIYYYFKTQQLISSTEYHHYIKNSISFAFLAKKVAFLTKNNKRVHSTLTQSFLSRYPTHTDPCRLSTT